MPDQPQHRPVKQRPRPLLDRPDTRSQKLAQLDLLDAQLPIAALTANLPLMLVRGLRSLRVGSETQRVRDLELLSDERRDARRNRRRILAQERTQHPHRPPLDREPQPVLVSTLLGDQAQRLSVQSEAPLQLKRRRISGEPSEARDLLIRQKLDRHGPASLRK